jgi:hypothetical protein
MIDMGHHRHAHLLGHLQGDVERHGARRTGGVQPHPHLDAHDEVAIGVGHSRAIDGVHQHEFAALAHHHAVVEAVDAGMGNVQIGEDAHLARLDHVPAKTHPVAGAGRARIDRRGDPAPAAEILGVDAERGAAPINVCVQVDQAGRNDQATQITHIRAAGEIEIVAERCDLAARKRHPRDAVDGLRRIENARAVQHQIKRHPHPLSAIRQPCTQPPLCPGSRMRRLKI